MIDELVMEMVYGVSEIFVKRSEDRKINVILVKVTNEILFSGSKESMGHFDTPIREQFTVSK